MQTPQTHLEIRFQASERWAGRSAASARLRLVSPRQMGVWAGRFLTIDLSICETRPESRPFCWGHHSSRKRLLALTWATWASFRWQSSGNARHAKRATWILRCVNILDVEACTPGLNRCGGGGVEEPRKQICIIKTRTTASYLIPSCRTVLS